MKFFNLLKKELSEIINAQMIASLVVVVALLLILGNVMTTSIKEAVSQEYTITVCDQDDTDFTAELFKNVEKYGGKVKKVDSDSDEFPEILKASGKNSVIIIPEGFSEAVENGKSPELISVEGMDSVSTLSNMTSGNSGAVNLIRKCISDVFADRAGLTEDDMKLINSPVTVTEHTVVKDRSSEVASSQILSQIMMQNLLLPIIVFILIMMTSQMLMNAISNEKIDKTLETLLSTPVSRTSILGAKMLSAAIAAMINALCFMVGFSGMMSSAAQSAVADFNTLAVTEYIPVDTALSELGLNLGAGDYVLIGIQLFLTIMICLSVSLVLGALVNDSKQSQTMMMPLMLAAMIPYMISMLADINTLPIAVRTIVYLIPFTHTFTAITNLMFGNTVMVFIGIAYQAVVFAVCMFLALRIFKSDKILTVSFNFGQKSKFKKNKG